MTRQQLTQQHLQDALWYCRETGQFFWRFDGGSPRGKAARGIKAGDRAGCLVRKQWQITVDGQRHASHRLAWLYIYGVMPAGALRYIDGDRTNIRIENLRPASPNIPKHPSSNDIQQQHNVTQCPGVTWSPRDNKWLANITSNGKKKYLGLFTDHADAVTARKAAEVQRQIPAPPAAALPAPPPHLPAPLW